MPGSDNVAGVQSCDHKGWVVNAAAKLRLAKMNLRIIFLRIIFTKLQVKPKT